MKALDYIKNCSIENNPREAFEAYIKMDGSSATWGYFRTQYNKLKNNSTDGESIEGNRKQDAIKDSGEYEALKISNYLELKELPDRPDLIATGTIFDEIISNRVDNGEVGGFTRQCCDITAGKPGSGKTTLRVHQIAEAKELNASLRVGFISSEMRESEWIQEIINFPLLKNVEVVYMTDYVGQPDYEDKLFEAMSLFDLWVGDSFPIFIDHIRAVPSEKRSEKEVTVALITKIIKSVEINNNNGQLINQANKDGNYKGGTLLPHMMSSMSFVELTDSGERYFMYTKNRNNGGTCKRKIFYEMRDSRLVIKEDVYRTTYLISGDELLNLKEFLSTRNESEDKLYSNNNQLDLIDSIEEIKKEEE